MQEQWIENCDSLLIIATMMNPVMIIIVLNIILYMYVL